MHADANFGTNPDLRQANEHVKGVGDPPIGRILKWHNAEIDVFAVHFLEDGGDGADGHVLDGLAEPAQGRQVAKTVFGAEKRDFQNPLKGSAAADDFPVDGANGDIAQRTFIVLKNVLDDFFFACRGEDVLAVLALDLADLAGEARPRLLMRSRIC